MKTFVVISDSHGRRKNVEKVAPLFAENDYVVHLGDGSTDLRDFFREHPESSCAETAIFRTAWTSTSSRMRACAFCAVTVTNTA